MYSPKFLFYCFRPLYGIALTVTHNPPFETLLKILRLQYFPMGENLSYPTAPTVVTIPLEPQSLIG